MDEAGYVQSVAGLEPIFTPGSIPYVRFDGQMSARRRQEAIARFSVPVKDRRSSHSSSQVARATRSRGKKDRAERPDSHDFDNDDDGDADFVLQDCEMESFDTEEENPRVMLISLKAVSEY